MYLDYFDEWEVRPEFEREFICIFDGWLGMERIHRLDEVVPSEWEKFNSFVASIATSHKMQIANVEERSIQEIDNIAATLSSYEDYMQCEDFTQYILPDLKCVLAQHWDFTWILWHANNGAVETLAPFVDKAGLFHFHD